MPFFFIFNKKTLTFIHYLKKRKHHDYMQTLRGQDIPLAMQRNFQHQLHVGPTSGPAHFLAVCEKATFLNSKSFREMERSSNKVLHRRRRLAQTLKCVTDRFKNIKNNNNNNSNYISVIPRKPALLFIRFQTCHSQFSRWKILYEICSPFLPIVMIFIISTSLFPQLADSCCDLRKTQTGQNSSI